MKALAALDRTQEWGPATVVAVRYLDAAVLRIAQLEEQALVASIMALDSWAYPGGAPKRVGALGWPRAPLTPEVQKWLDGASRGEGGERPAVRRRWWRGWGTR